MKVLLTGATGYIGRRLLPELVARGYEVICPVRDRRRFNFDDFTDDFLSHVKVIEVDFNQEETMGELPETFDIGFYLIHSLNSRATDFQELEERSATNFANYCQNARPLQVIYVGGIVNDNELTPHLKSRLNVEEILKGGCGCPTTVLRAGLVIGSGSKSFEIIRDLVEKLPVMVAPRWLNKKCQPISITNLLEYLVNCISNQDCFDRVFDVGGSAVITYKDMLMIYAKVRGLRRFILVVPVLSPRLSSLWLYFITSTPYNLARNLIDSIKNDVIVRNDSIDDIIPLKQKFSYEESLKITFSALKNNSVVSSWKDTFLNPEFNSSFIVQHEAPKYGVYIDERWTIFNEDYDRVLNNLWQIGGDRGWYYGNYLWRIRGLMDQFVGGVGLRRGRRSPTDLKNGDSLDFWRVLYADKNEPRLLLFAEMRLPGEAWLEFKIRPYKNGWKLIQTATFRPKGILGRLYWWMLVPFHLFIFRGMMKNMISFQGSAEKSNSMEMIRELEE